MSHGPLSQVYAWINVYIHIYFFAGARGGGSRVFNPAYACMYVEIGTDDQVVTLYRLSAIQRQNGMEKVQCTPGYDKPEHMTSAIKPYRSIPERTVHA